jgi:glucosamine-6-phosphate deaminase
MTLTMSYIMSVAEAICVVPTDRKANAVYGALEGPVTTECPASILRKHANAALYLDKNSAAKVL